MCQIVSSWRLMLGLVELLLGWLTSLVKSRRRLRAENLVLRHQLNILRRRAARRVRLCDVDRLVFVWLCRLRPAVAHAVTIVKPETIIGWHRRGYRAFWRRLRPSPCNLHPAAPDIAEFIEGFRQTIRVRRGVNAGEDGACRRSQLLDAVGPPDQGQELVRH
jgi:hypothetical protein